MPPCFIGTVAQDKHILIHFERHGFVTRHVSVTHICPHIPLLSKNSANIDKYTKTTKCINSHGD